MRDLTDEIYWGTAPDGIWLAQIADAVTQFDPVGQRLGQVVPLVEAASATVEDYGNMSTQITLGVTRQHDTPAACRYFMLDHLKTFAALAASATPRPLTLRYLGGDISEFTIPAAIVTAIPGQMIGSTSRFTYAIAGGAIT